MKGIEEMNLGEFDGKTVLVTGAAQGIGSVVAKMFLERGATVIAVDQNEEVKRTLK